jgi:heat shock protein HslJ
MTTSHGASSRRSRFSRLGLAVALAASVLAVPALPASPAAAADAFTLSGVYPSVGRTSGLGSPPSNVTLLGTGFTSSTTVTIGGDPCTYRSVASDGTQYSCQITGPATAAGPFDVVATEGGVTKTRSNAYRFIVPKTAEITGLPRRTERTSGEIGTFAITTREYGTVTADDIIVLSPMPCFSQTITIGTAASTTQYGMLSSMVSGTAPAPVVAERTVYESKFYKVNVPCSGASSVAGLEPFITSTIIINPKGGGSSSKATVSKVSPSSGVAGDSVKITGSNLSDATVKVGGFPCKVTANTATSVTCRVPSGAKGAADVVVTTSAGSTTKKGGFTYESSTGKPSVSKVDPASGEAGDTVTISGSNLWGAKVTIGGKTCAVTANSATSVSCTVPSVLGANDVVVTTATGSSTKSGGFTYVRPPTVSGVSPSSGDAGDTITISGTNLSGATVMVGGYACKVTARTATSVTCKVPSGSSGSADVVVTTAGGSATEENGFSYSGSTPAPTASGVSPSSATAGASITISGTDLWGAKVTVGGKPCVVTANTATSVTCTVPSGSAGSKNVVVTTATGSETLTDGFTQTEPTKPSRPRDVRVVKTHADGVTLRWNTPESDGGAPITGYRVAYRLVGQKAYTRFAEVTELTARVTGLKSGKRYWVVVRAVNKVGAGQTRSITKSVTIAG